MTVLSLILVGVIFAVLVGRALWIMRSEDPKPTRGVDPGPGYTEIRSEYFSGVGGGNDQVTRVPRDPQEYARAFVPKQRDKR